jgi:hypothetical protein
VSRALLGAVQEQLQFPAQHLRTLLTNAALPLTGLLHGGVSGGLRGTWDAIRGAGEDAIGHLINQGGRGLNEVVTLWDRLRGEYHERRLNADEITSLRRLYGDSIDYGAVRIQYGGSKEGLGASGAHVVDNTIWMDSSMIDRNGKLNADGQDLLSHEMCHVWQYQNRGPSYLGEALWSQWTMGRTARQDGEHQGLGNALRLVHAGQSGRGLRGDEPRAAGGIGDVRCPVLE